MLDDALRVRPSLRCRDEQAVAARAQLIERRRDAVVDLVLEHADRVVALAVELEHPVGVLVAGELGEALAQRRTDDPAEFGLGGNRPGAAILGVEPAQGLARGSLDSGRGIGQRAVEVEQDRRGFGHFSST